MKILAGMAIGLALGAVIAAVFLQQRAHWLAQYEFRLTPPPVPEAVLNLVRDAEARSYADRPLWRRVGEAAQDVAAFASPRLVYDLNLSVGRYRVKARTIETILPWAEAQGYIRMDAATRHLSHHAIAYFSEQPSISDWQAAVYLDWLRGDHPALKDLEWDKIASDPMLIAKLYSGYMGAGGAWDEWRATTAPGPEALRRLGLNAG